MKRMVFLLLAMLMLLLCPTMQLRAEAAERAVAWNLIDGVLTISGSGPMEDYDWDSAPWCSQREEIVSVVVENGVTSIGEYAFEKCTSLTDIALPESLTDIGNYAFYYCKSITSIAIPESVTSIGDGTFFECYSLTNITIPDSVTAIGDHTFYGCKRLSSITIPDSVTSIDNAAFSGCKSLTGITIPDSVTAIGERAFQSCKSLTVITIPDSVTSIGLGAFQSCRSLTVITIPDSVTSIGFQSFDDCTSLRSITIPDSVTEIGYGAFFGCTSLTDITLSDSVTSIGYHAFDYCTSLSTVHYAGTEAQKADIEIEEDNGYLEEATWHYECDCIHFADIAADAYYAEPVLWAVEEGITNGLSADSFGPEATCTRGQIVTFLWRANGSPEPKMEFNPFSDVSSSDYFYNAVLWAVENGITSGMGDGTFAPNAGCTRGQVATFLWRAEGKPASDGENIFTDITPGAYYYDAVLWAVANGVTNGMGEGIFAPDATCTRGQIVTFLYRAMN